MPFTIVQLSDPHIGAPWTPDPAAALATAVAAVRRTLPVAPAAVVVSGDIANTPVEAEYACARGLLAELAVPVYPLAGNHDDRAALRRHLVVPDGDEGSLSYAADLGPVRLVALDSTRPGSAGGELGPARLEWLHRTLSEDPATPTLLATHHPPLVTGLAAMDSIGLPHADRRALGEVVSRHRQVQTIAAGHIHRTIVGECGGVPVLVVPGTGAQLALDFDAHDVVITDEPPCFAVHALVAGRIVSHIQPIQTERR